MAAVGEVMAAEQKKLRAEFKAELEREIMALKNEFLQDRLDQERVKRLKVVPSGSVIA